MKQMLPIDVIHDDHCEISERGSITIEKGRSKTFCSEHGVSFLVVCFSELDNNLPTILGVGNEDYLGSFRVRVRVSFVVELNLASGVRDEGGDVRGKSSFRGDREIYTGIRCF